jgi:hypothetical protein
MKKIVLYKLILVLLSIPYHSYSQKSDSTYLINKYGITNIKIGDRIKKEQLLLYPNYKRMVKIHHQFGHLRFTKEYFLKDGLSIFLTKKKRGSFIYLVKSISVKYPCKAITDKGIEIGKSSKNDVIKKYGKPNHKSDVLFIYNTYSNHYLYFFFNKDSTNIVSEITIR